MRGAKRPPQRRPPILNDRNEPGRTRGSRPYELCIERDGHVVPHQEPARLKRCVPDKSKVFPVDARRGGDPYPSRAPRVLNWSSRPLDLKYDIASNAVDRKIALDCKFINSHFRNASRFEGQNREFLDVEEISALQMRIPLRLPGVDRGGVDRGLDS